MTLQRQQVHCTPAELQLSKSTSSTGLMQLKYSMAEEEGFSETVTGTHNGLTKATLLCSCHHQTPTGRKPEPLLIGLSRKAHWVLDIFNEIIIFGQLLLCCIF